MDEALCAGLRLRLDDMKQRLSRLDERATKKRTLAVEAMTEAALARLEQPDFTASVRAGIPSVVVTAEDAIPRDFWLPQPPKLDRQSLLRELKRSVEVPGAQLSNSKARTLGEDEVMALSGTQLRQLKAKLDGRYVKTRKSDGAELSYVEGWHVIAEANRIFGYDAWDRRTVATSCVSSSGSGQHHVAVYIAKVRITVRAGDTVVVREGSGTGEGNGVTAGQAHEVALKSAETDATKRALSTFGNPFGLALYDREQLGVRRCRDRKTSAPSGPWILRSASGAEQAAFERPAEFAARLRGAMSEAKDIELLFAIWEQNVEAVRRINRSLSHNDPSSLVASQLVAHLKRCAVALVKPNTVENRKIENVEKSRQPAARIDKSALTIGETRRIRCREHLRFVASQPCVVCGRAPSHAHHVRHAQARGLGLKVSDEFAVPLCATHHHHLHQTTKEQDWWQERKIDPLVVARRLWRETRDPSAAAAVASASDPLSDQPSTGGERKPADGVVS